MNLQSKEEKRTQWVAHIILAMASLTALVPFWLLVSASFSDDSYAVKNGYKFLPELLSLDAYTYVFQQWDQIGRAYMMTILVTVIGTVLSICFTSALSYGLNQKVPGVKAIFILILITMLINGGIVPTYIVYNNLLKVKNTIWGLILPNLLMNGFTVILVKNYLLHNIPKELLEAAQVDGSGHFGTFFKIVFPLSKPILATVGLMSAVFYWNDWTNGLYYISDESLYTIQLLLNKMNENILFMANNAQNMVGIDMATIPSATMRMAIAVIGILPIIMAYPFFQKYFVKGITMGSVKG